MPSFKNILLLDLMLVFVSAVPDNTAHKLPVDDITIKIHGYGPDFFRGEFLIDIHKTDAHIKIVYSVLDSLRVSAFRTDTEATQIGRQHHQLDLSEPAMHHPFPARYTEMIEKYKAFTRDSVLLDTKSYPGYCNLLDRVTATSADVLENKEHNINRMVLDGSGVSYQISTNSGTKTITVTSPNAESHPLLYELLNSSEKLYRDNKK